MNLDNKKEIEDALSIKIYKHLTDIIFAFCKHNFMKNVSFVK